MSYIYTTKNPDQIQTKDTRIHRILGIFRYEASFIYKRTTLSRYNVNFGEKRSFRGYFHRRRPLGIRLNVSYKMKKMSRNNYY